MIFVPEQFKIVDASVGNVTTNGGVTCDYVSLKNVIMAWIVLTFTQAVGHATGIDPKQATAVDGTGAKVFANVLPIWANEATGTDDTLVKQTSAVTYDLTNDIATKQVIFQVDPALLDTANDFDVLGCSIDDSSQATNLVNVQYWLEMKDAQATPVSAIVD